MIVPGMFVCSSFLISVCMFIVSKALLISSATVIVRTVGAIWLNPFATVLFSVCRSQSARTILWSEIPGMEIQALTSEGYLQQKRSSRFWALVGSLCIC